MIIYSHMFLIMISYTVICIIVIFYVTNNGNSEVFAQYQAYKVPETCDVEGEIYEIADVPYVKCFDCICKSKRVECKRRQCPNVDGCFMLENLKKDECCQKCKGCIKNGLYHESGTEWVDAVDPCRLFTCVAGIITESQIQCHVPCKNPTLPALGQCCPSCPDCRMENKKIVSKNPIVSDVDPCITCDCSSNLLTCTKKTCPILNCPKLNVVQEYKKCCPKCLGSRSLLNPPNGDCLLVSTETVYSSGANFKLDDCTRCSCNNSTITCHKQNCPILKCKKEDQRILDGHCCPFCVSDHQPHKVEHKSENEQNHYQDERDKKDGTCTFFGGSHVRTFDGKVYAFMGTCKYHLVSDCDEKSFNMRLKNEAVGNFIVTKRISFKLNNVKIDLQRNRRIKVNDEIVDVPFVLKNRLSINGTQEEILVDTTVGIKIFWTYDGLIEVTMPFRYRQQVCGLCGNFNSVKDDDFTTRDNILVEEATVFAQSWTDGNDTCLETKKYGYRGCQPDRDQRLCNHMRGAVFERCLKKINVTPYYETCLKDMCECPPDDLQCYCESFTRYINDCSTFGISIPNWKKSVGC